MKPLIVVRPCKHMVEPWQPMAMYWWDMVVPGAKYRDSRIIMRMSGANQNVASSETEYDQERGRLIPGASGASQNVTRSDPG